jgi:hypothetical protein
MQPHAETHYPPPSPDSDKTDAAESSTPRSCFAELAQKNLNSVDSWLAVAIEGS